MAEIYSVNGLVPENIYYNGADADSVWQNGEMVWERGAAHSHYRIDFPRQGISETFSDYSSRVGDMYPDYDMSSGLFGSRTFFFKYLEDVPAYTAEDAVIPWASRKSADDYMKLAIAPDTYGDFYYVIDVATLAGATLPKTLFKFSGMVSGLSQAVRHVSVEINTDGSVSLIDGDGDQSKGSVDVSEMARDMNTALKPIHVTYIDGEFRMFTDFLPGNDIPKHTTPTTLEITAEDVGKKGGRSCTVEFEGITEVPPGIVSMESWSGRQARVKSPAWNHKENRWKNVMMQTITESGVYDCPEGYHVGYGMAYGAGGSGSVHSSASSSKYGHGGYSGTTSPVIIDPREGSFTVECGVGGAPVVDKNSSTSGNPGSATKIYAADKELASAGGGEGGESSSSTAGGQDVSDFDYWGRHWVGAKGGASSTRSSDGEPGEVLGGGGGGGRAAYSSSNRRPSGKGGDGGVVICWVEE